MFSFFWGGSKPANDTNAAPRPAEAPKPAPAPTAAITSPPVPAPIRRHVAPAAGSSFFSERSMRQLAVFFAGASFFAISTMVTKRAINRRKLAVFPKFYQPSNQPVAKPESSDGPLAAVEALNLATLNVMSFAIMMAGGISWTLNVSSLEDLRALARRHIGPPGGQTEDEMEEEVVEWMSKVLDRKGKREQDRDQASSARGR